MIATALHEIATGGSVSDLLTAVIIRSDLLLCQQVVAEQLPSACTRRDTD